MRLRLRLLLLVLASFFRKRLSLVDENVLQLRVLPNDVDVTRLSSDRYLPLMDLGRINIERDRPDPQPHGRRGREPHARPIAQADCRAAKR